MGMANKLFGPASSSSRGVQSVDDIRKEGDICGSHAAEGGTDLWDGSAGDAESRNYRAANIRALAESAD